MVTEAEKKNWKTLAKDKYPKPLIFHDGRLAFKPTPLTTLALFTWVPCGFFIALIRIIIGVSLPYNISSPLLAFTGLHLTTSEPKKTKDQQKLKGNLYACNHRTLLDPLYLAFTLKRDLVAVTYSLSKMSEILAPIKTVRLTRNRDEDAEMMKRLLKDGDLVVCPEGTTCREAYLLRFSPLFSELCEEIVPVAMDCGVTMFHGTTAGGLKCLDPLLFMMNPTPCYSVQLLENVSSPSLRSGRMSEEARFEVANEVSRKIGRVLGFECTTLNRKDKYLVLAGNEGAVSTTKTGRTV